MDCSMQMEDSLQSRLEEVSLHFQSRNLRQSRLTEVSLHFRSRDLSQSRLTDGLPSFHPRPPIASQMGYVSFRGATWLLQQGIRIHRIPLSSLSSSPRPLVH